MKFYEIEFPLANLNSEEVEAALLEIGASSITFLDRGDEPVLEPKPGEVRLWSDTLVRALFEESQDPARNMGRLADAPRAAHHCARAHAARRRTADGSVRGSRIGNRCVSGGGCGCARQPPTRRDDP